MIPFICITEWFHDFIHKPRSKPSLFQAKAKTSASCKQVNHEKLILELISHSLVYHFELPIDMVAGRIIYILSQIGH